MRTQGTYYIRGTEGRKDGRTDGRTEGRNAENYVPPLFFQKAGDNKRLYIANTYALKKILQSKIHQISLVFLQILAKNYYPVTMATDMKMKERYMIYMFWHENKQS